MGSHHTASYRVGAFSGCRRAVDEFRATQNITTPMNRRAHHHSSLIFPRAMTTPARDITPFNLNGLSVTFTRLGERYAERANEGSARHFYNDHGWGFEAVWWIKGHRPSGLRRGQQFGV